MRTILLLCVLVLVSGCNKKFKETMGIATAGPDEYQVQRAKTLEVPPHYDLPVPVDQDVRVKKYVDDSQNLNKGEKALIQAVQ